MVKSSDFDSLEKSNLNSKNMPPILELINHLDSSITTEKHREIDPNDQAAKRQFTDAEEFFQRLRNLENMSAEKRSKILRKLRSEAFEIVCDKLDQFKEIGNAISGLQDKCLLARELYIYGDFFLVSSEQPEQAFPVALRIVEALAPVCFPDSRISGECEKFQSNIQERYNELVAGLREQGYEGEVAVPTCQRDFSQVLAGIRSRREDVSNNGGSVLKNGETWEEFIWSDRQESEKLR